MATTSSQWAALAGRYNYQGGKPGVTTQDELWRATLKRRDRRSTPRPNRVRVAAAAHA